MKENSKVVTYIINGKLTNISVSRFTGFEISAIEFNYLK